MIQDHNRCREFHGSLDKPLNAGDAVFTNSIHLKAGDGSDCGAVLRRLSR